MTLPTTLHRVQEITKKAENQGIGEHPLSTEPPQLLRGQCPGRPGEMIANQRQLHDGRGPKSVEVTHSDHRDKPVSAAPAASLGKHGFFSSSDFQVWLGPSTLPVADFDNLVP